MLGPWDVDDEHTINYLAPIAQGLLGKSVGDTAEMPGQHGPTQVTITAIDRIV